MVRVSSPDGVVRVSDDGRYAVYVAEVNLVYLDASLPVDRIQALQLHFLPVPRFLLRRVEVGFSFASVRRCPRWRDEVCVWKPIDSSSSFARPWTAV
jgi:hypothetical protein